MYPQAVVRLQTKLRDLGTGGSRMLELYCLG